MALLLRTLNTELVALNESGASHLDSLLSESELALSGLRDLEAELVAQIESPETKDAMEIEDSGADFLGKIERQHKLWYKALIDHLKGYNAQITKFQRNTVNSSAYSVDLDDAYTFPLLLDSFPLQGKGVSATKSFESRPGSAGVADFYKNDTHIDGMERGAGNTLNGEPRAVKVENRQHLMRSIVLHLLKSGYGNAVADMMDDFGVAGSIDHVTLRQFMDLSDIVDDIKKKHDLTRALAWVASRASAGKEPYNKVLFKLHMLQFVLLLSGQKSDETSSLDGLSRAPENVTASQNTAAAVAAYTYSKLHFPQYLKDHISDISPIMSLLLFKTNPTDNESACHLALFRQKLHQAFLDSSETKKRSAHDTQYVSEILAHFDRIHDRSEFFEKLASEFVHEFCKSLGLLTDSSLFQAVLAGHVNLPNFHKYSQLQKKLNRVTDNATDVETDSMATRDLPFSLPSKNQFLFNYHPIFICPISKEQLMPIISLKHLEEAENNDRKRKQLFVSNNEVLVSPGNPVVVFEHCRHLALKESVRQLTRNGTDVFKCHYCYKKHKLLEVSDAYFIDL